MDLLWWKIWWHETLHCWCISGHIYTVLYFLITGTVQCFTLKYTLDSWFLMVIAHYLHGCCSFECSHLSWFSKHCEYMGWFTIISHSEHINESLFHNCKLSKIIYRTDVLKMVIICDPWIVSWMLQVKVMHRIILMS